jgi:DNA-binding response OmpR family regulator
LVVDETPGLCGLIACQLGALGYHVLTASDGREAQAMIREAGPTNISMLMTESKIAGMRRGELAEWFRDENPCAKILLMCMQVRDMRTGKDLESIHKPFQMKEIGKLVSALLGGVAVAGLAA